jgi:hypothetical protein
MEMQPDFRELLALFNAHHVEYLIVGGYALAFHGAPRFTGDLDIFVKPDTANAQRILTALEAFGFGCSRWYLKPMAGMCHDYQWVIVFAEPVGIVVKASSDKKLHIGLKERILNPF